MTSKFKAKIEISSKKNTKSIFESIQTDEKYYSENHTITKLSYGKRILITMQAQELPRLRANLNSILRLIQTSNDSIESVKI